MVDGRKNHKSHPYEETKNTIDNGRQLEREKICVLRYGEEKKYCKRHEERSKCAPRRRRGKEALKNVPPSHSIRMKRCVRDENSRRKYDLTWRGSGVNTIATDAAAATAATAATAAATSAASPKENALVHKSNDILFLWKALRRPITGVQ
ncbi:hypothetical protein HZH68_013789 [Vespula germanica]|uniref:Uncharacterized protein n=1 Tax=Vespula germanica TaxID=30212 RepID=A0A834JBJ5_VESGE|nr:hypothetical protein HZH68_013789 [Vespula germanica]